MPGALVDAHIGHEFPPDGVKHVGGHLIGHGDGVAQGGQSSHGFAPDGIVSRSHFPHAKIAEVQVIPCTHNSQTRHPAVEDGVVRIGAGEDLLRPQAVEHGDDHGIFAHASPDVIDDLGEMMELGGHKEHVRREGLARQQAGETDGLAVYSDTLILIAGFARLVCNNAAG